MYTSRRDVWRVCRNVCRVPHGLVVCFSVLQWSMRPPCLVRAPHSVPSRYSTYSPGPIRNESAMRSQRSFSAPSHLVSPAVATSM